MARKKIIKEFVEQEEENLHTVEIIEPTVVPGGDPDGTVSARVKGTWVMFWGQSSWDFKDGTRYKLPRGLYDYLKSTGNIYDTL
jgi:hypothetical protein